MTAYNEVPTVSTYSPEGEPETTLQIPRDWYAAGWPRPMIYDGSHIILTDRVAGEIYIFTKHARVVGKASLGPERRYLLGPYPARKGRELWIIDARSLTVHRYENPVLSGR